MKSKLTVGQYASACTGSPLWSWGSVVQTAFQRGRPVVGAGASGCVGVAVGGGWRGGTGGGAIAGGLGGWAGPLAGGAGATGPIIMCIAIGGNEVPGMAAGWPGTCRGLKCGGGGIDGGGAKGGSM